MVIPVILFVALNVWATFAADISSQSFARTVTTVNVPVGASNWLIGSTLNPFFESGFASPFTRESRQAFMDAWDQVRAGDAVTQGKFTFTSDFVSSMEEKASLLEISASLEGTYMAYSADAHMSFMQQNIMSETDISAIVRASSAGRKWQMSSVDIDLLELDTVSDDIVTLADFTDKYGDYLIVGWIYGGEIVYESTYSAKSEESKQEIQAELCGSYGKSGFSVSGCTETKSTSEHRAEALDYREKSSIRPNKGDDPDTKDLISALSILSQGQSGEDGNLHERLQQSAQKVLAGDPLDPLQAVVVPLSSVRAVHEKFKGEDGDTVTTGFMKFLNEMYWKVEGLSQQLKMVKEQWGDSETDGHPMPSSTIQQWERSLSLLNDELLKLKTKELLIAKSAEYQAILRTKPWDADVLTAGSFVELTLSGLEDQFAEAIMEPYEDMLEWATKPLKYFGKEPDFSLGRCEGDCGHDRDCSGHLECWQRKGNGMPVPPGCSGIPIGEYDYCWDPKFTLPLVNKGGTATNLGQCEGDCDKDSDCRGGLKCYHRGFWVSGNPPGCSGSPHARSHDYCWGGEQGIVSALSPGVMMEDPFDADYDPIVEDPSNQNPTLYVIHYYDLIPVLLAALVVLCGVNLCVTVRQRHQRVDSKHRTLW